MLARFAVLVFVSLLAATCSAPVDLARNCRISPETTGWFDAGITEDGKNKLVPSIVFRVSNTGSRSLGQVQFNCLFKRVGDPEEHSAVLLRGASVGVDDLAPGATTGPITVRAPQGYTGTEPRVTMLGNRLFVDFKVEIFGKAGSATPVKLGEFPIKRQLLAMQ
jgi:hypothetical protein